MTCCFCDEINTPLACQYYTSLGKKIHLPSRILMETKNWYVVPTLGCLTVGYVLLVCKQHELSLANLSCDLYQEMLELKRTVESFLYKKLNMKCIAFEHGVTSLSVNGANSVDHVHLHILPFHRPIFNSICREKNISNYHPATFESLPSIWSNSFPDSYLLFQDTDQSLYYVPNATEYPSQFFRSCIASHLNRSWNWKKEYHIDNFLKTVSLFHSI